MPLTVPIVLFLLIAAVLGVVAFARRSRRLALMAAGAFTMVLIFSVVLALSLSRM